MKGLRITRLLEPLWVGSSQPWLVRASDGERWVVKFRGAGAGAEALAAELLVNRVARAWGLRVPAVAPIALGPEVERAGTDEFWDVLAASEGANLAQRYVPDAEPVDLRTQRPSVGTIAAIVRVDSVFSNADRSRRNSNLLRDAKGRTWLIDHGSCRFLHTLGRARGFELPRNHFLAGRAARELFALVGRPTPLRAATIAELVADLPAEWLAATSTDHAALPALVAARTLAFAEHVERGFLDT